MAFDYDFEIKIDGETKTLKYSTIIKALDIEKEIVHGQPLKAGGAPQALTVKGLVEKGWPGSEVSVFTNGNQIF